MRAVHDPSLCTLTGALHLDVTFGAPVLDDTPAPCSRTWLAHGLLGRRQISQFIKR
jgi:hypothetical protein